MAEFIDYYQNELKYLRDAGQEFAKAHPEIAAQLNLEAGDDADPYVERLFEGFSFLSAKIQQKQDESITHLASTLLEQIEPVLLRPVPSMTMLQFTPRAGMLNTPKELHKNTIVHSQLKSGIKRPCQFSVMEELEVLPIEIQHAEFSQSASGAKLQFQLRKIARTVEDFPFQQLRFHIKNDENLAWVLYYLLSERLNGITLTHNEQKFTLPLKNLQPIGLDRKELLLPEELYSLPSTALLREYFSFEDKFLGFTLHLPKHLQMLEWKELNINFQVAAGHAGDSLNQIKHDLFALNAVPAVNAFSAPMHPVVYDHSKFEHTLQSEHPESTEIYRADEVTLSSKNGKEKCALCNHAHYSPGKDENGTFIMQYRNNSFGQRVASAAFQLKQSPDFLSNAVVSGNGVFTNGKHPREHLQVGDIKVPPSGFPESLAFTNYTRPTQTITPLSMDERQWSLVQTFNAGHHGLLQQNQLVEFLKLLSQGCRTGQVKLIQNIVNVSSTHKNCFYKGAMLRGIDMHIEFRDDRLTDNSLMELGRYALFSKVLFSLIRDQAPLNTPTSLTVTLNPLGEEFHFDMQMENSR